MFKKIKNVVLNRQTAKLLTQWVGVFPLDEICYILTRLAHGGLEKIEKLVGLTALEIKMNKIL